MKEIAVPFRFREGAVQWTANPIELEKQHLWALFATWDGERVMLRSYGGPFRDPIFDPAVASTVSHLIELVRQAVTYWVPKVELIDVSYDEDFDSTPYGTPDSAVIPLVVVYRVVGMEPVTQQITVLSVDGQLQEVTV